VLKIPGDGDLTCKNALFEATAKATKVTSISVSVSYTGCTLAGVEATVLMQGCQYAFGADGSFQITSAPGKNCTNEPIDISSKGCHILIPEQVRGGLTYTNINPSGKNDEVTMAMSVPEVSGVSNPGCKAEGEFVAGEFTTGNTILTGEEDPGTAAIPMKWVATVP
jgi:hypothetical protein